jgi:hypothetical protein
MVIEREEEEKEEEEENKMKEEEEERKDKLPMFSFWIRYCIRILSLFA